MTRTTTTLLAIPVAAALAGCSAGSVIACAFFTCPEIPLALIAVVFVIWVVAKLSGDG